MLQDLIDLEKLRDYVRGVARCSGLAVTVFDARGRHQVHARRTAVVGEASPEPMRTDLSIDSCGKAALRWVEADSRGHAVAPVRARRNVVGYVSVGGFTKPSDADRDRAGETACWAAQTLSHWLSSESRLDTLSDELALVSDIGELLAGDADLPTVLDRIARETSRVMNCKYTSLRLYDPASGAMRIASAFNLSERYKDRGIVMRSESPIDDAALNGELVYIEDAQSDERIRFRAEARNLGIRSGLTCGLFHRGVALGVLRVYSDRRRSFRAADRDLLRAVASQAATAIDNARRMEEGLRAAELERQLELAGQVQARMMRRDIPHHDRVAVAMLFEPSWHLGGDFCDVFRLADGRLTAVIGDVVGHGPAASLLMAGVRGALRAGAQTTSDLGELLVRLNQQVCGDTTPAEFVTLLVVAVDAAGGLLSYANAGHDPLILLREGTTVHPDVGELVLGLEPDTEYAEQSLDLQADDFLLLYTDGIVEAMNFDDELLGRDRLTELVKTYGVLDSRQALQNIHWDVRRFCGLADQIDDQTMVGLRVLR
jgi:sigma-B regulation protein RsbU (phosphoserine phosphatase)